MELVDGGFEQQARQAFRNLTAVIAAAGGTPADAVKLTVYLMDMDDFPGVNAVMAEFFEEPFRPGRPSASPHCRAGRSSRSMASWCWNADAAWSKHRFAAQARWACRRELRETRVGRSFGTRIRNGAAPR